MLRWQLTLGKWTARMTGAACLIASIAAAAPPAAPAGTPAPTSAAPSSGAPAKAAPTSSAPAANEPLAGGALRYAAPAGWELVSRSDDGLKAAYQLPGRGHIEIVVIRHDQVIAPDMKEPMARQIAKAIRDSARQHHTEIDLAPRVEDDPRFFLKMHDRLRPDEGGPLADRLQMYRSMGTYFVYVAVTALVQAPDQSAPILTAAEDLLANLRTAQGVKPIVFPRSALRILPPVDWRVQKPDNANGTAAVFSDPADPIRQIIVRTRVIPKNARQDEGKRDLLLDRMIDEDRRQPPLGGYRRRPSHAEQQEPDAKFLRRIRSDADRDKQMLRVDTRYLVVGDVLVSVRSVTEDGDSEVPRLGDVLATELKPLEEGESK
jgi:hypothetical protein